MLVIVRVICFTIIKRSRINGKVLGCLHCQYHASPSSSLRTPTQSVYRSLICQMIVYVWLTSARRTVNTHIRAPPNQSGFLPLLRSRNRLYHLTPSHDTNTSLALFRSFNWPSQRGLSILLISSSCHQLHHCFSLTTHQYLCKKLYYIIAQSIYLPVLC